MIEPRFLFDTNILIYLIRGTRRGLRSRVEQLAPGEAVTSALCVAELQVGLQDANPDERAAVDRVLRVVEPMPFDVSAAVAFGALPYRRGQSDRLIAAHALSRGLTLVTNNEADFADIPGLKVENWTR